MLDPDKMIILGSREVCGLNKILIDFKKEYNIEKLPREINFGQLVYRDNKRFIEGIKYVYTPKGKLKMYKKNTEDIKYREGPWGICLLP